ncbi:MAG TPA: hypothetical protein VF606_08250 [Geminicoccaceae bacterium]|jgi:hypothetical protein
MTALAERVQAAAALPPLSELAPADREELQREIARATALEDLPGRWQAAILAAESGEQPATGKSCCH